MKEKWSCSGCGYLHDGSEAPGSCPMCGAGAAKFARLDAPAADRVERARNTNAYHFRLFDLARQIERVCKEGIQDELDPQCVAIFKKGLAYSYELMKLSMVEMKNHAEQGRWG
jgi:rubredoxin